MKITKEIKKIASISETKTTVKWYIGYLAEVLDIILAIKLTTLQCLLQNDKF